MTALATPEWLLPQLASARFIAPRGEWHAQLGDVKVGEAVVLFPARPRAEGVVARWLRPFWKRDSSDLAQLCGELLQQGLGDIRCVEDPKRRNVAIVATRKIAR